MSGFSMLHRLGDPMCVQPPESYALLHPTQLGWTKILFVASSLSFCSMQNIPRLRDFDLNSDTSSFSRSSSFRRSDTSFFVTHHPMFSLCKWVNGLEPRPRQRSSIRRGRATELVFMSSWHCLKLGGKELGSIILAAASKLARLSARRRDQARVWYG